MGFVQLASLDTAAMQSQMTAAISGVISDETDAVIGGAHITAIRVATGERREVRTDGFGRFSLLLLQPGAYTLLVRATGFREARVENIVAAVTETAHLRIKLRVGVREETSFVVANPNALGTDGPQLGRVIDEQAIRELPLGTRNFTQILSLSPGASTYLPDSTSVGRNTQAISVNGARVTQNNFQINGIDANTLGTNGPILVAVPAPETIQEFKVQTSSYDATYGRAGGANIQVLTKTGTNEYHGAAYWYVRNEALNANDGFLDEAGVRRPVLRRNVYGGLVGGPLRKDRVFFFGSYQGTREANGASLNNSISSNVLIAPGLTNDRSEGTLLATFKPVLANGQPATAIHPSALALLNATLPDGNYLIPTPGPNGRFTASSRSFYQEDQFNVNFDARWGTQDSISAKFFFANNTQQLALPSFRGTGPNVPGYGSDEVFNNRVLALQHIHEFSAAVLNEVRLGYAFNRNNTTPREPVTDTDVGIQRINASDFPGLPLIRIAPGSNGLIIGTSARIDGRAAPATFTMNDTLSVRRRTHFFRGGFEERYNLIDFAIPRSSRGQLDVQDFNNFLVGQVRTSTLGTGSASRSWRAFDSDVFLHDQWRISPRLTLSFGVRYEIDLPVHDTRGRLVTFDPALYRPRLQVDAQNMPIGPPAGGLIQAGNSTGALNLPEIPDGEKTLMSADLGNIVPRVGFALSLHERTVLHGGYGLYYSRPTFQYASVTDSLPPYYVLATRSSAPLTDPFPRLPRTADFPIMVEGVPLTGTAFDRRQEIPYVHQFNISFQHQLPRDLRFELGYVGSRGRRLFRQIAINQAPLASSEMPIPNPVTGAMITANTPVNAPLRAPYQGVSINGFLLNRSDSESSYDALQASFTGSNSKHVQFLVSYTFSRSIDDSSGQGGGAGVSGLVNPSTVGDSNNVLGNQLERVSNRGLSDFHRKHRLVGSFVWDMSNGFRPTNRLPGGILGDWQLSGIVTAMSGLPIDIVDTAAGSLYGLSNASSPMARPSLLEGLSCEMAKHNVPPGYFFNPYVFRSPIILAGEPIPSSRNRATASARGTDLGNVPRNCLVGPSQTNVDASISKEFNLSESKTIGIRIDCFNLFNHPNRANPVSNLSGASIENTGRISQPGSFGLITSSSANRRLIQIAVRMSF